MKEILPNWDSKKYLSVDGDSINSSVKTNATARCRGVLRFNLANMKEIKHFMKQA